MDMKCTKANKDMKNMNNMYIYRHVISKYMYHHCVSWRPNNTLNLDYVINTDNENNTYIFANYMPVYYMYILFMLFISLFAFVHFIYILSYLFH